MEFDRLSPKFRTFVINLFSVGIYQAVNLIILVFLVPFYIAHYGIESFGIINLSQAFGLYILALCDYNFLVKGVRDVSQNISSPDIIGKYYLESLVSKFILFGFGFIFGLVIIFIVPNFNVNCFDLMIGMIYGLSLSFLPVWLLQGLQYTQPLAYVHAPIRLLGVLGIYFYLNLKADYTFVNIFLCISNFIASIIIVIILVRQNKISFRRKISFNSIKQNFKIGQKVCFSNICVNTYMNLNTVILGVFASAEAVGIYSVAEKAIIGFRQILSIVASILYPIYCEKILILTSSFNRFVLKSGFLLILAYILFAIFIIVFRSEIIQLLNNNVFNSTEYVSTKILIILAISLPIVAFNVPFSLSLNALGKEVYVSNFAIITVFVSIVSNIFFSKFFYEIGTAYSVLFTELFFTTLVVILSFKLKVFQSK